MKMQVLFRDCDLLPPATKSEPNRSSEMPAPSTDFDPRPIDDPASSSSRHVSPGEATAKFLAATSVRLKSLLQGSKQASDVVGDTNYDMPETEYLTHDGQPVSLEPWTMPESNLTLQERKLKKEFLQKTSPKTEQSRPTKTRAGTHSKPEAVNPLEQWMLAHRLKLGASGLAIVLLFVAWQFFHSFFAQQLVNNGFEQLSKDHPNDALTTFSQAIQIDGQNSSAYFGRGNAYRQKDELTKAFDDYSAALKMSPNRIAVLNRRASLCLQLQRNEQAVSDYSLLLQIAPGAAKPQMLQNRATAYVGLGEYEKALQDYEVAFKADPSGSKALADSGELLTLCQARAGAYEKIKEYGKAAADYTTAISLAPHDYLLYLSRARCYQQLKDYKRAIADCTSAAKLSPKTAEIYQFRGTLHEQFGNPLNAYKDFTTGISINSKNVDAYVSRGHNCLAKDDYAAALADFDQALKVDPKSADAQAGRSKTLAATGIPKKAIVDGVSGAPENVSVPVTSKNIDFSKISTKSLIEDGYDRLQKGFAEQSIPLLSEAVRRDRNAPISRRYLAHALLRSGGPFEAIGQFEALRKLGGLLPADQQAMQEAMRTVQANKESKGSEQFKGSGENDAAVLSKYRAAILYNPKDVDTRYNLALIYSKSGKTEDAIHECLTGMSDAPPNSEAQQKFYRLYASLAAHQSPSKP
jgi:tetratricopeptide (TPR) repeat protein